MKTKKTKKMKTRKVSRGKADAGAIVADVNKEFGKGALIRYGSNEVIDPGPRVSTGSYSLDAALGGGGLPFGRVVEIFGPESSGKTTLALHILANVQKMGYVGAMVDAEHALDPEYAKVLSVDLDSLLISQPDYGEQALAIVERLVYSGVRVIVIDSVAALTPKAELDGEMEDITIGLQARLMGKAMRKLIAVVNKCKTLVIFINQVRATIGGFGGNTTPGGKALKFYASVRIDIRRIKTEEEKGIKISNFVTAKIVKSKICAPFRVGEFFITFNKGIDRAKEILHWAKKGKIIKTGGGGIVKYKNFKAKGRAKFISQLREKKKLKRKLISETISFIESTF